MKVIKTSSAVVKTACQSFPALAMHLYYISQQSLHLPNHAGLRKVGKKWSHSFFGVQKQEGSLGGEQCIPVSSPGAAGWATKGEILLWEGRNTAGNRIYLSMAFWWPFLFLVPTVLVFSDTSEMVTF